MFGILSGFDRAQLQPGTPGAIHLWTEAARRAYFDRNRSLGDPDFVPDPTARLLAPGYIARLRSTISLDRATPSASLGSVGGPPENHQTTHYSVVDRWGNAVSVTYTINDGFGAKVVAGRTGVLLNDEMDDFTAKPGEPNTYGLIQGKANAIAPGKRPLSSMAPAIVLDKGQVKWVLGAPGGARIITTVAQVMLDMIDGGMTPEAAVDAPRWHHQWLPDTVGLEPGLLSEDQRRQLEVMGHTIEAMTELGLGECDRADRGEESGGRQAGARRGQRSPGSRRFRGRPLIRIASARRRVSVVRLARDPSPPPGPGTRSTAAWRSGGCPAGRGQGPRRG